MSGFTPVDPIVGGGGTPGGADGNIQFRLDATTFGGDSNLFWNNTAKRLGIGTATPDVNLHSAQAVAASTALVGLFENSTPNIASAISETTNINFGFGGINDAVVIEAFKEEDFTVTANQSAGILFRTKLDGVVNERLRISAAGVVSISNLTQSSVMFAGAGGAISQNNTNFRWDDTNNRLGIANPNTLQYRLDVGNLSYFAIHGGFAHIMQHNSAASTFWSFAPRNGGDMDIAVTTTDPRPSGGTIGTANNAISIKTNKDVHFLGNAGVGVTPTSGKLHIQQTGAANALAISHENADGNAINISNPKQTFASVVDVFNCNALTTGKVARFHSNSASTANRDIVQIHNANALATGATCLTVTQDADRRAVFIAQNTDSTAVIIDSASTTSSVLQFAAPATTTGAIIQIADANSLTTGKIANFVSNSASTSARTLVQIHNDNAAAVNAIGLTVIQDAAEVALKITHNGNESGIFVSAAGSSSAAVCADFAANNLTIGAAVRVRSSSASTSTRRLMVIENTNAAANSARCLDVIQSSSATAIDIATSGNGRAISIVPSAATTSVQISVLGADALTTGEALICRSNSSVKTGNLIEFSLQNATPTAATVLSINQSGGGNALEINASGGGSAISIVNPTNSTNSTIAVSGANNLITGAILTLVSNSASTGVRNIANLVNDNTLATGCAVLRLQQDANRGIIDYSGTSGATVNVPITTLTTLGAVQGHVQIIINGTKRWMPFYADPS